MAYKNVAIKVIKVKQLGLMDKDMVELKDFNDFVTINKMFFNNKGLIYAFDNNFYMVGADIVFIYSRNGSVKL